MITADPPDTGGAQALFAAIAILVAFYLLMHP